MLGLDADGEPLPAKKVRGSKAGNAIVLRSVPEPRRLFAGEGIETGLSVWYVLAIAGVTAVSAMLAPRWMRW